MRDFLLFFYLSSTSVSIIIGIILLIIAKRIESGQKMMVDKISAVVSSIHSKSAAQELVKEIKS